MIVVRDLCKRAGGMPVLNGVNCEISPGEVISVIGPPEGGRGMFLRCLNLMEKADGGSIVADEKNILEPGVDEQFLRSRMGMVFPEGHLFSHLMVVENVMLPQQLLLGMGRQAAYDEAMRLLELTGMADVPLAYPDELSEGERQRTSIARCLSMRPEMVLFDEPTGGLDQAETSEVRAVLRKLSTQQGLTMVVSTGDLPFARRVSSRVMFMDGGVIVEEGTPEEVFLRPKRRETYKFVIRLNRYEVRVTSRKVDLFKINAGFEQFAQRVYLPKKKLRQLEMCAEEVLVNLLMPKLRDEYVDVKVGADYFEETGEVRFAVAYFGPQVDVLEEEGVFSTELVRKNAKQIEEKMSNGRNLFLLTLR